MTDYPRITLKPGRERALSRRHPWIFSGAIAKKPKGVVTGTVVEVFSSSGDFAALGHYFESSIAIKILSFERERIDAQFFAQKIELALSLRKRLGLLNSGETNAFRLINAEGDGIPGLIADLYDDVLVMQFHNAALEQHANDIVAALQSCLGGRLHAVYLIRGESADDAERGEYLLGSARVGDVRECGLAFTIDWARGQKTGFFLDQRENRQLVRRYSSGARVVNAFCYTGGFSVAAAAGGAAGVTSIDASERALTLCRENFERNTATIPHEVIRGDCMKVLGELPAEADVVILDPPAFAKHRNAVSGALRGYENLNLLGLRLVRSGGLVLSFSCSQLVSRDEFRQCVQGAAVRSGRRVQIVHEMHQAPCHPVSVFHPEGEYLKGFVLAVS